MNPLAVLLRKDWPQKVPPIPAAPEISPNKNFLIHVYPAMYCLTKSGAISSYEVEVVNKSPHFEIHRRHAAVMTGKAILDVTEVKSGVNQGKKNETTAREQAFLEAESLTNRLRDQGYKTLKDLGLEGKKVTEELILRAFGGNKTDAQNRPKPMLAGRDKSKIIYPAHQQPKLDGHRCLAIREEKGVVLLSRKGKPVYLENVEKELIRLMKSGEIFDGELYCKEMSLQEIASAVRSQGEHKDKERIQFVIFDLPGTEEWKLRRDKMVKIATDRKIDYFVPNVRTNKDTVCMLLTFEIHNRKELDGHHAMFRKNGYEGSIIRNFKGKYEFGHRSADLIKVKDYLDDEFKIVGVEQATGRDAATAVFMFEVKLKDGTMSTFKARPEGTYEERADYWHHRKKMIGQIWTVRYSEISDNGTPQHPVAVEQRADA